MQKRPVFSAEQFNEAESRVIGDQVANPGDWVVTHANGSTDIYADAAFHAQFEEVLSP